MSILAARLSLTPSLVVTKALPVAAPNVLLSTVTLMIIKK